MDTAPFPGIGRSEVTRLLVDWGDDAHSASRLFPLVYDDLRQLAAGYLRHERRNHTLQPTALVHESFCRLVDGARCDAKDRRHFFALAARAMRRVLVEHARKRRAAKRGGEAGFASLDAHGDVAADRSAYVVALDEALADLANFDPRQARIVELRFFGGLSIEDTGEVLGISHATVEREWRLAKAWLHRCITDGDSP